MTKEILQGTLYTNKATSRFRYVVQLNPDKGTVDFTGWIEQEGFLLKDLSAPGGSVKLTTFTRWAAGPASDELAAQLQATLEAEAPAEESMAEVVEAVESLPELPVPTEVEEMEELVALEAPRESVSTEPHTEITAIEVGTTYVNAQGEERYVRAERIGGALRMVRVGVHWHSEAEMLGWAVGIRTD